MALRFSKLEGLGNDFIVVRGRSVVTPAQAVMLCDRHRGVGADGVLMISRGTGRPFMEVINTDGSSAEMCGNGLRCVAFELCRTGERDEGVPFEIETGVGRHRCVVRGTQISVTTQAPAREPGRVPVLAARPVVEEAWEVSGRTIRVTALSMGNPHVVTFDEVGDQRLSLGPTLGADRRFPRGVNVGFAGILPARAPDAAAGPTHIALEVYERGAGWTRACGTGACAAAVAAVVTGRARRHQPLAVQLPGGELTIVVGAEGEGVLMTGPARHVFEGSLELSRLGVET